MFNNQAEPPHDASNGINCFDCHYIKHQNGILKIIVPRGAEQETICKSCHSPDGQASSMSSVANHVVNNGDTIIDCGSCHDPHSPNMTKDPHTDVEAINLSLIRKETRHVDSALDLAIFQQRPEHFAFDDDNEPWNGICQTCHTQTSHHTNDNSADHSHFIGSDCTGCHPHGEGFMAAGGGSCDGCHGAPPVSGAHAKHFGGNADQASYGGTDNLSSATDYIFQCGNCHPLSSAKHSNGIVDIELYNAGAPAGSLKNLNPPTADYVLGTCSNIYCHSKTDWSSPDPISDPLDDPGTGYPILDSNGNLTYGPYTVTTFTVYSSVNWEDPPQDCNSCHRNPPQTSYPGVQAAVGNSHAWIDGWGYENLHAFNMSFDPLMCRTCHYNTVTESTTWSRDGMDITTFGDVPIANKAYHVNGEKDVAFDTVNTVTYNSVFSLDETVYNPGDKTCSSVPCHLNQPKPQWGKPYRWGWGTFECDQCHHYGGPWPSQGMGMQFSSSHQGDSGQNCSECHEVHN